MPVFAARNSESEEHSSCSIWKSTSSKKIAVTRPGLLRSTCCPATLNFSNFLHFRSSALNAEFLSHRRVKNQELETVVLVHGLFGSKLDMWRMSKNLDQLGFRSLNWGYRSIGQRIETVVDLLGRDLSRLNRRTKRRFHVVTHSMGGVILRAVLETWKFNSLGRVTMLAPPHSGSHVARVMAPWFNWLSPCLGQLSDDSQSFVNRLPNSFLNNQIEFGLVEAKRDRVVRSGSVVIPGYEDYAIVDGHHGFLPWYPQTVNLVGNFLKNGRFNCRAIASGTKSNEHLEGRQAAV